MTKMAGSAGPPLKIWDTPSLRTRVTERIGKAERCNFAVGVAVVVCALLTSSITSASIILSQPIHVATLSGGQVAMSSDGEILSTADARVPVPLVALPVLPLSILSNVRTLTAKIIDAGLNTTVQTSFTITEVRHVNATFSELLTAVPGRSIVVLNGVAFVYQARSARATFTDFLLGGSADAALGGQATFICAADVVCSAFKLPAAMDVDGLIAQATDALHQQGFDPSPLLQAKGHSSRGRKMQGGYMDMSFMQGHSPLNDATISVNIGFSIGFSSDFTVAGAGD